MVLESLKAIKSSEKEATTKIEQSKTQAEKIIESARMESKRSAEEKLSQAHKEGQKMIAQARKEAEEEAEGILKQAEEETASLESSATAKMDKARETIVKQLLAWVYKINFKIPNLAFIYRGVIDIEGDDLTLSESIKMEEIIEMFLNFS